MEKKASIHFWISGISHHEKEAGGKTKMDAMDTINFVFRTILSQKTAYCG